MRERRLRDVVLAESTAVDRIFWTDLWFSVGNARSAALLPRLTRLDALFLRTSERRLARALQYRGYRSKAGLATMRLLLTHARRSYRYMLVTDIRHIALFRGRVVVETPDLYFNADEIELLNHANVAAYVVTSEHAVRRLSELGVRTPGHVIPQGVDLEVLANERLLESARGRRDGRVVVGYAASLLFAHGDAEAEHPLYGIEHLLDLWDEIHERVPNATLWLLGRATDSVRERVRDRGDVRLFGWLPRDEALAHIAAFDIALYPRTYRSVSAIKVAEYLGAGVPTVSYDHEAADLVREGGGILVESPREFVEAVARLATDDDQRRRLADEARAIGRGLDWDVLAHRYETEILDVYLPR